MIAAQPAKALDVSNFVLYTGVRLYVIFTQANTAESPTLNVNRTGAKPIKLGSNSSPGTNEPTWSSPASGSTASSAWNGIKANVIYEAYYDGTNWILSAMNGPSMGVKGYYFSTSKSYIKFTNGLIIQWLLLSWSSTRHREFEATLPVSFTSQTSYITVITPSSPTINSFGVGSYNSANNKVKGVVYGLISEDRCTGVQIFTIGY